MKSFEILAALLGTTALAASAQDDNEIRKMKLDAEQMFAQAKAAAGAAVAEPGDKVTVQVRALEKMVAESKMLGITGAAMGATVKGAPYSGTETVETNQVLGDGTVIHNEQRTTVYRDSEGRVRRETPKDVTIWDPVTNASYILDPTNQTARKVTIARNFVYVTKTQQAGGGGGGTKSFEVKADEGGVTSVMVDGKPADPSTVKLDHMPVTIERQPAGGGVFLSGMAARNIEGTPESESLGKQTMEGVVVEGTRTTRTIETGAIGNDRPIKIVEERWMSPDLKTPVMTRRSDPRTGEETFRLTNVSRGEPAAYLFQVPAGYQEK